MTTTRKRKVSVSLDEDLVAELESGGEALSAQVNEAIRAELSRRRRHRLLDEMLVDLEAAHGPANERLVKKYLDLLGMSRVLVLDAEALSALARRRGPQFHEVRAAIEAARRLHREIITPAVILAELYRGPGHNQVVDSCLSRESFIDVRDTDREFARYVGGILNAAHAESSDLADAHAVAVAVEAGGGVILSVDQHDLNRLSAAYPNIDVVGI